MQSMKQEFPWKNGGINMDNFIKVDEVDEENTNILYRRFVQRYREEKGRLFTDHESNLCWWNICGVVMRDGYDSAKEYVDKVKLG
jgi:hypothetical protein